MANNSPRIVQLVPVLRPEEVLAERYDQLRAWAVGLTRGDVNAALDVVHDLYLYITLAKPDFSRVENPDNYLYKCLRHIHLAHLAESSRNALQQISVADLDSLPFALWASPETFVLERQNDLRRVCRYAVWRKDNIKSASFFVLRFFHGYHLQEIAEITILSMSVVQPKLSRMRSEIEHYLEQPDDPQFAGVPTEELPWTRVPSPELFRQLRATILGARSGDCPNEDELLAHYRSPVPKAISCALLSHIVSCEDCLSTVDRHFQRPTLRDREPLDGLSSTARRKPEKAGATMSSLGHKEMLEIVLRHRRDVYEHRPRLLSIAADGKIIASHRVQAQKSVQSARIERPEQIGCVEVFSEQDVRLAMILIEDLPPQGPAVRFEHVELSNGRWIEVKLVFDSLGLNSEVTYFDPMQPADAAETAQEEDAEVVPLRILPSLPAEGRTMRDQTSSSKSGSEDADARHDARRHEAQRAWSFSMRWSRLGLGAIRMSLPDMNPFLASAIVLGMVAVLCFVFWLRIAPTPSVTELLDHAQKSERAMVSASRPGVIYEKVAIRSARHTIERTIYRDAQGIRRPRRQKLSPEDEQLKKKLASAGVNWDAPLSAGEFADWRDRSGATRDLVTRPGPHLLRLTTTPVSDGAILRESLTVRDTDFHPVDRTVDLRDSGTIEIAELNYQVLPWANAASFFEESVSAIAAPIPEVAALPSLPQPIANPLETELVVRYALHGIGADMGEPVDNRTGMQGPASVSVVGIVASPARKQELLAALNGIPRVSVRLQTEEEAAALLLRGSVTRAEPSVVPAHSPIEKELLEHFGDPSAVEDFSKHAAVLTEGLKAHAWALRHLAERYSAPEARDELAFSPSSSQLLRIMRRDHYKAMRDETAELTTLLEPILQSTVQARPESTPRLPLFESAQEVQRLTLDLLSGLGTPDKTGSIQPTEAEHDLLDALHDLAFNLEEQP